MKNPTHGSAWLLSEIAMRELIDAQGREFAAETLRQRLQIHLVAFLHLLKVTLGKHLEQNLLTLTANFFRKIPTSSLKVKLLGSLKGSWG